MSSTEPISATEINRQMSEAKSARLFVDDLLLDMLIGRDHLDISNQRESGPVLAALREANGQPGGTRPGGFVWLFRLGPNDADPTLVVGVRGEIGALAWYEGDDELVPADGINEDEADRYWIWSGHEAPKCPSIRFMRRSTS